MSDAPRLIASVRMMFTSRMTGASSPSSTSLSRSIVSCWDSSTTSREVSAESTTDISSMTFFSLRARGARLIDGNNVVLARDVGRDELEDRRIDLEVREVDRRNAELSRQRLGDVVLADVAQLDERLAELHSGGLDFPQPFLKLLARDEFRLDEEIPELDGHFLILAGQGAAGGSVFLAMLSGVLAGPAGPEDFVPAVIFVRRAVTDPMGITVLAIPGRRRSSSENQRKSFPRLRSSSVSFSRSWGCSLKASNTPASVSTRSFPRTWALSL